MKSDLLQISTQIVERIEEYITANKLEPHERLPSEREFCEIWNCNRMTLRLAIKRLINEGVLYNIHGSGTYLAEKKIERNLWQFTSFTQAMKKNGYEVKNKLILIRKIEANKKISKELKILLGKEVVEIKRLRIVDARPLAIEVSYIPYSFCKGIENYDLEKNSLYDILCQEYGIKLVRATQEIQITYTTDEESEMLGVAPCTAILMLKGVAFDEKEQPVEFSKHLVRGDRCRFNSILK